MEGERNRGKTAAQRLSSTIDYATHSRLDTPAWSLPSALPSSTPVSGSFTASRRPVCRNGILDHIERHSTSLWCFRQSHAVECASTLTETAYGS